MARTNKRESARQSYAEGFAARIIEGLKNGTAPWIRPWKAGEFTPPFNPLSGTHYKGANFVELAAQGFADPRWMTLKQANAQEWRIKKGEKSRQVVYWQFTRKEALLDDAGKPVLDPDGTTVTVDVPRDRPVISVANVFHASQIEGNIPVWEPLERSWDTSARAEKILENSGAVIKHDQRDRAFYSPRADAIHLPAPERFPSAEKFYSTALHELAHWTAHPERLDRDAGGAFGSESYAREELRAEIASWMVCMDLGLPHEPGPHLSYVQSWIKALEEDPYEIVRACQDAEKIRQYVLGMEMEKEVVKDAALTQETQKAAPQRKAEAAQEKAVTPLAARQNLDVPYAEKNEAKALGAKWDGREKCWYAPEGSDLAAFEHWLPEKNKMQAPNPAISPEVEFAERLKDAGLDLKGELPLMDGRLHRVPLLDRPQGRDGAYRGNLDGRPAGWFQNHVTGETANWKYSGHKLASRDIAKLREETLAKREAQKQERQEGHDRAAKRCYAIWKSTPAWATGNEPYLQEKGVPAFGVKVDAKGNLLIAGRDANGIIRTLQTILPEAKRFERGSRKTGAFHVIDPDKRFGQGPLLIAEGYATAASVHLATKQPVVCAFDAGNLVHVAKALREKFPERPLAIMADNDLTNAANPGINKAKLAVEAVGGSVYAPEFTEAEAAAGLKDWNDLHKAHGMAAMRQQIDFSRPLYQAQGMTQSQTRSVEAEAQQKETLAKTRAEKQKAAQRAKTQDEGLEL